VPRADEIDIAMVNGIGFPSHVGGPMWWADTVGLDRVRDTMRAWAARDPDGWTPAPLLEQLAASGRRFYEAESGA
jgi:3-hydroxyacyl-CoA dehydrogenase